MKFLLARVRNAAVAAACLPATACLASRSDVQVLQHDVQLVRNEAARDDSIRRADIRRLSDGLRSLSDSLSALSTRLTSLRSQVQTRFSSLEDQVQRAQELAGQSQARIQEIRASIEQVRQPADSAGVLGPNQLYQAGRDQFSRGSNGTARAAFQQFLDRFPASDLADDAQFYVAETFAAEGRTEDADSTYAVVAARFRTSVRAATAIYKRAIIAETGGRTQAATRLFNEVIARFPRSDETALARDRLRAR